MGCVRGRDINFFRHHANQTSCAQSMRNRNVWRDIISNNTDMLLCLYFILLSTSLATTAVDHMSVWDIHNWCISHYKHTPALNPKCELNPDNDRKLVNLMAEQEQSCCRGWPLRENQRGRQSSTSSLEASGLHICYKTNSKAGAECSRRGYKIVWHGSLHFWCCCVSSSRSGPWLGFASDIVRLMDKREEQWV